MNFLDVFRRRITPRTCLWPLVGTLCVTFALSIGLTYRSDHHCYAGTCGEWLFPLQARLHVVVWYAWISLSVLILALRAFQPSVGNLLRTSWPLDIPVLRKQLRLGGVLLVFWICGLYGILVGIWWVRVRDYFAAKGVGLAGNSIVAAVAQTGHLADVTMGMVLLPVSRHSALASFFKLSPTTTYTFHMVQAYVLFGLVLIHGVLYARWAALFNQARDQYRRRIPVLNPTYLYDEVWPGHRSSLAVWRASLIFTGIVSSLIMMAMFLTSFPSIRRKRFNLFYFTHLFSIVAVVVICLHASTMFYCTIPGLSMWLLDWGMRFHELRQKLDSRLAPLGNGWYCLTLPLPRRRLVGCACHSPLAHFYIHHSRSSLREIHPFTTITHLASKKAFVEDGAEFINIQFLFRQSVTVPDLTQPSQPSLKKSTQWTNKLASLADEESVDGDVTATPAPGVQTALRLEGPYFNPANPSSYRNVVCFVAGTGLSGAIAIAAAFAADTSKPSADSEGGGEKLTLAEKCSMPAQRVGRWRRCVVVWSVREADYTDMPFFESLGCDDVHFHVHLTGGSHARLDMPQILAEICGDGKDGEAGGGGQGDDTWCYISGPNGFLDAAERACRQVHGLTTFAARWD